MDYKIRPIKPEEYPLLNEFLYEAIYVPEGVEPPPKSIIDLPELKVYIEDFGKSPHDHAFVAEVNGKVVGAVWCRIMNDYGHIDNETPSLAIAVYKEYRGLGIGTALLKKLLYNLKLNGYSKVSLSVQKTNKALKLYQNVGFKVFRENYDESIMILYL